MEEGSGMTKPGPEIRIAVKNFGPVAEGEIDLRPLTVFVGPSNTGKTWFAVLIYALHRVLNGFPEFPPVLDYLLRLFGDFPNMLETIQNILDKIDSSPKRLRISDLDESDRETIQSFLTDPKYLGEDLSGQLARCFGLESIVGLIREPQARRRAHVSLAIGGDSAPPWNFHMDVSRSKIATEGKIEALDLERIEKNFEKIFSGKSFFDIIGNISEAAKLPDAHYLPANRMGLMHSHRAVAVSLIQQAPRAGPAPPPFPGVTADFMQRLVQYEDPDHTPDARPPRSSTEIAKIAEGLERDTLGGQIQVVRPFAGGYPEFVYRPSGWKTSLPLARASSMVSELAPVVLTVRSGVRAGDTLFIDEPEAHLHPAAQAAMAAVLARLVRAGVRVVATTHSDWLLKEIGNLMREGELEDRLGRSGGAARDSVSLRPRDVGIWLFRAGGDARGSKTREIRFDRVEGIEPSDYEDVAEELYNRSAELQNRLEEAGNADDGQA